MCCLTSNLFDLHSNNKKKKKKFATNLHIRPNVILGRMTQMVVLFIGIGQNRIIYNDKPNQRLKIIQFMIK